MSKTVIAVFENGVFKPKDPVDLDENTEVRLIVDRVEAPPGGRSVEGLGRGRREGTEGNVAVSRARAR